MAHPTLHHRKACLEEYIGHHFGKELVDTGTLPRCRNRLLHYKGEVPVMFSAQRCHLWLFSQNILQNPQQYWLQIRLQSLECLPLDDTACWSKVVHCQTGLKTLPVRSFWSNVHQMSIINAMLRIFWNLALINKAY